MNIPFPPLRAGARCRLASLFLLMVVPGMAALPGMWAAANALPDAAGLVRTSGFSGGICAVVGSRDAGLALAIAREANYTVHCLAPDQASCDALRRAFRAAGCYGPVSAAVLTGTRLPYADNLVNLLVAEGECKLSAEEIRRVLVPNGVAYFNGSRMVKPWPAEIDEWTHYLHGADGNPVANDRVVGPPGQFQWIAEPLWLRCHETDSSVSTLVTAQGRLFAIVDEAPISLVGQHALPDKWFLVARDAFNGVPLWKVPIRRWGWREWKDTWFNSRPGDIPLNIQKRLVAAGDRLYVTLGYQAPVTELDARTGAILQTYAGTERTNEILCRNGILILSVLTEGGAKVVAVNAASGATLWTSANTYRGTTTDYIKWVISPVSRSVPKLDPALNAAWDGDAVALIDGPDLVCLDAGTGAERWRAAFPLDEDDKKRDGTGNLWVGTLIVRDGVVLHASPAKLAAFSSATGKLLWSQPKKYIGHLWYEWKEVFVIGELVWTWSANLGAAELAEGPKGKQVVLYPKSASGYDLKTGVLKKEVSTGDIFKANHHHRCYRSKATSRYILASRRGTEFVDLEQGRHSVHNWVRGSCHVGMMPANGLHYAPPHPCACYLDEKLNGFLALAPGPASQTAAATLSPPLQKGPAYAAVPESHTTTREDDWPVFRHDAARSGSVPTRVPDNAAPLWRVQAGGRVTPPVVAGNRLFVALPDAHHIACLDARDGRKVWEFAAGGRIDSPPAWHEGRLLFGSADGWVYCLRAEDGALAWRFQAAPAERWIGAFGQLESAWPVHGSVLVLNGTVYCTAGRSSELDGGIYLCALDAATGEVRHQRRLEGPDYAVNAAGRLVTEPEPPGGPAGFDANHRLPMGALSDVLMSDGQRIFMRSAVFDLALQPETGKPDLLPRTGYLDDTYFKRTPWTCGGEYANLVVKDKNSVYYVRQFESMKALDPMVYFTPGAKGYLLFAKNAGTRKNTWLKHVPVRIRAMVLAGDRLLVAGPPDVVDPKDPLGAFEDRKGGLLCFVDVASGEEIAGHKLDAPPVFNGLAAAAGRLFIATSQGEVLCFGAPGPG